MMIEYKFKLKFVTNDITQFNFKKIRQILLFVYTTAGTPSPLIDEGLAG